MAYTIEVASYEDSEVFNTDERKKGFRIQNAFPSFICACYRISIGRQKHTQ
jgi:hypothetical protein